MKVGLTIRKNCGVMMAKKEKDPLEEYLKLKNEMIRDKFNEIFRTQPINWKADLEEIGFKYYEEEDEEEIEERKACPKNKAQRELVAYLQGEGELTEKLLTTLVTERFRKRPNLPLIRKYFKSANQRLKALIIWGLDRYPASLELLSDLTYFHEFENVLRLIIFYYTRACENQTNLQVFTELAQDFYYATKPDDYEALLALRELFEPYTEKRKIIDFLISEEKKEEEEIIEF
jgi:hypothetical protein